jgi:hypothetical protein
MELRLAPLQTARLRLEPLTAETARAILAGDLSGLAATGLTAADGWPHDDTADGLAGAVKTGYPPGWLVTAGGAVIGDIGTHGPVDEAGSVAASWRRRASPTSASTKAKPSTSGHKSSGASREPREDNARRGY